LNVNGPKRPLAFIAYLVPIFGWLYVLLFDRRDEFAVYHAKQAVMLTITAVVVPVAWAVAAWILTWIPLVGSVLAVSLFALVMLAYLFLAAVWIAGMINALTAQAKPLPVVGRWAERISIGG
jgi:uncharacterized membrane protein